MKSLNKPLVIAAFFSLLFCVSLFLMSFISTSNEIHTAAKVLLERIDKAFDVKTKMTYDELLYYSALIDEYEKMRIEYPSANIPSQQERQNNIRRLIAMHSAPNGTEGGGRDYSSGVFTQKPGRKKGAGVGTRDERPDVLMYSMLTREQKAFFDQYYTFSNQDSFAGAVKGMEDILGEYNKNKSPSLKLRKGMLPTEQSLPDYSPKTRFVIPQSFLQVEPEHVVPATWNNDFIEIQEPDSTFVIKESMLWKDVKLKLVKPK